MRHSGLSGKIFPIHLKPKDDELLSSWIARLSIAHGLTPKELSSLMLPQWRGAFNRIKNIDLRPGRAKRQLGDMLVALSEMCAVPLNRAIGTTLDEYHGRLYNRRDISNLYSWITPLQQIVEPPYTTFGMQVCPRCLSEDSMPYFRRRWRFAFVTACPNHKALLIDSCPACGSPIQFYQSVARQGCRYGAMANCFKCLFDLRTTKRQKSVGIDVLEFQEHLVRTVGQRIMKIKGVKAITTGNYFETLYWMSRIITHWHPLMHTVQKAVSTYYGIRPGEVRGPIGHTVESLNVRKRGKLMRILYGLLTDPPTKYLQPSVLPDLMSRVWFDKYCRTPFWQGVIYAKRKGYSRVYRQKFPEEFVYSQHIHSYELKEAIAQLFCDGVSTLHLSNIFSFRRNDVVGIGHNGLRMKTPW